VLCAGHDAESYAFFVSSQWSSCVVCSVCAALSPQDEAALLVAQSGPAVAPAVARARPVDAMSMVMRDMVFS